MALRIINTILLLIILFIIWKMKMKLFETLDFKTNRVHAKNITERAKEILDVLEEMQQTNNQSHEQVNETEIPGIPGVEDSEDSLEPLDFDTEHSL